MIDTLARTRMRGLQRHFAPRRRFRPLLPDQWHAMVQCRRLALALRAKSASPWWTPGIMSHADLSVIDGRDFTGSGTWVDGTGTEPTVVASPRRATATGAVVRYRAGADLLAQAPGADGVGYNDRYGGLSFGRQKLGVYQ